MRLYLHRPAILAGIKPGCSTSAEEAGLGNAWRLHTGWELPEHIPYIVGVRFSADEDEAVIGVPSCSVWSAGGLAVVPATTRSGTAQAILRRLAGALYATAGTLKYNHACNAQLCSCATATRPSRLALTN